MWFNAAVVGLFLFSILICIRQLCAWGGRYGVVTGAIEGARDRYNLRPLVLPTLSGLPFRLLTKAMEEPLLRWLLLPKLFADNGFYRIRAISYCLNDAPTFFPLITPNSRGATSVTTQDEGDTQSDSGTSHGGSRKVTRSRTRTLPFDAKLLNELEATLFTSVDEVDEVEGFQFKGIGDYIDAYKSGTCSPEDVAEEVIKALRDSDNQSPPLKAFVEWRENEIRDMARESSLRYAAGRPISPLDGIPIAVKDEVDMEGWKTYAGAPFPMDSDVDEFGNATHDSHVVQRLREAGALLIGKCNMHEIGIGTTGFNKTWGVPRNPYNSACFTGGSSSGSGACVAAGICPVSIGADGGGSIRIPASLCGMVGLKATYGRVSEHGAAPLCWTVGHLGPIGVSVRECALVYAAIAGRDPRDVNTLVQGANQPTLQFHRELSPSSSSIRGLRMGVYTPYFDDCDEPVRRKCHEMLTHFEKACGAKRVEIEIPMLDEIKSAHAMTIIAEMVTGMTKYHDQAHRFQLETRSGLALGRNISATDYILSQRLRTKVIDHARSLFEDDIDVIVTPATGCLAPAINVASFPEGDQDISRTATIMRYAFYANFTGVPAITFPCGYDEKTRLPIAFQVMAKWWDEDILFKFALMAEKLHKSQKPLSFHYDILPTE